MVDLNAIEKATIAKGVADYIINHLLVEEPMSATELESLAKDVAEDKRNFRCKRV